ncbi:MAG TPA: hypothetical protein VM692_16145, partial [Gammaproteobacteria bacterium]|nr:hypothetical protein [Gammaproteobacteria bacterium]
DPAFVLVETALGADGEPVTTSEQAANRVVNGKTRWHVVTLGQSVPLSHASALEGAVSFAASRNIPVVYERDESAALSQAAAPSSGLTGVAASAALAAASSSAAK